MITIDQLRALDISKISNAKLAEKLEGFLKELEGETSQSLKGFTEAQQAITSLYRLVEKFSPEAIPAKEESPKTSGQKEKAKVKTSETKKKQDPEKAEKPKPSKEEKEQKKTPTSDNEETLKELEALDPTLENCRRVVREHQAKKRAAKGPKPKPTRHTQLKTKLLSIISLIPEKLADDEKVLEETEEILLDTHSRLIETWGMDKKKAQSGAAAIEEKFDALEEKKDKEERKKLAKRWKNQLPDVDTLMRKEWKDSEGLENEAKEMLDDLKEAIKLFEQDRQKAKDFLTKRYSKEQIGRHLPAFITEILYNK